MSNELDEDSPLWLINEQIKGLLDGEGAGEDHEAVTAFFAATGLPAATVASIHEAIVHGRAKSRLWLNRASLRDQNRMHEHMQNERSLYRGDSKDGT